MPAGSGLRLAARSRDAHTRCELRARAHAELRVDARERALDGLLAEEERGGDLLVGGALGDELGDLALARRERPASLAPLSRHARAEPPQLACGRRVELVRAAASGLRGDVLQRRLVAGGAAGEQARLEPEAQRAV